MVNDDNQWLIYLVGGLEQDFFYDFPYIGNVIIPTDEVIFFRGVGIPPTRVLACELTSSTKKCERSMLFRARSETKANGFDASNSLGVCSRGLLDLSKS